LTFNKSLKPDPNDVEIIDGTNGPLPVFAVITARRDNDSGAPL
jgi:hypothetical protein